MDEGHARRDCAQEGAGGAGARGSRGGCRVRAPREAGRQRRAAGSIRQAARDPSQGRFAVDAPALRHVGPDRRLLLRVSMAANARAGGGPARRGGAGRHSRGAVDGCAPARRSAMDSALRILVDVPIPARRLAASVGEHAVLVDLRGQRRRLHGARPIPPVLRPLRRHRHSDPGIVGAAFGLPHHRGERRHLGHSRAPIWCCSRAPRC